MLNGGRSLLRLPRFSYHLTPMTMMRFVSCLLLVVGLLFVTSGCDTAADSQPSSQTDLSPLSFSLLNVEADSTGKLALATAETAFIGGTQFTFTLQAVVGVPGVPFGTNTAEYFIVEGNYAVTDPNGAPTRKMSLSCQTQFDAGAGPLVAEDAENERFVAFFARDFVDVLAGGNVTVTRTCTDGNDSVQVRGDLLADTDFSSFPTAPFPGPLSFTPPPPQSSPLFSDVDTFGSSGANLVAAGASGDFTPYGVPFAFIRSKARTSRPATCTSTLGPVGSDADPAVIEANGTNDFVALAPSNIGDLFEGAPDLLFERTCVASGASATVSGIL